MAELDIESKLAKDKDRVEQKYPLTEHLIELRKRVVYIFAGLAVVFIGTYSQGRVLMNYLLEPLVRYMPENSTVSFLKITEGFVTELKLAAIAAVFVAMPYILYQLWKFIAPGLYAQERKYVFGFVFSASVLFFTGASFAYFIVFPFGFQFFLKYAGPEWNMVANLSVSWYLTFVTRLIMAFGLVFEMPVIVFFLVKMGVVNEQMLVKHRRYAIVGIFVAAAVLTPPDVISQTAMAVPLLVLYQISIYIARVFGRKRELENTDVAIYD